MKNNFYKKLLLVIPFLISGFTIYAQQATITGQVLDETNNPLPYASVDVKGTTIGTSADINGKFAIIGVPVGSQTIEFSYVGYETKLAPVTVAKGKSMELNAKLAPITIQGKEVVITAQARGQAQAINQQLNALGIVNVVSVDKMKELPDNNAAEAIGRLPGIMVQRDGGEGSKVIIRGLDPKYSTVSVNGVVAPASSATDRSTDLNLISPDIISGIEVSKANTADQDADGMGGTVNLLVKEADANRRLTVSAQGGYSGQIQQVSNYKATLFYNDRFFNKKLGVMLAGNIESYDRSADRLTVSYYPNGFNTPQIDNESLRATSTRRNRYNGSAIFDFRINANHVIKMVNMYSQTSSDIFERRKTYLLQDDANPNQLRYEQTSSNPTSYMVSSALDGKHILGNTELTWAASYAQTKSQTPNANTLQFRQAGQGFIDPGTASYLDPLEATNPDNTSEDIRAFYLRQGIYLSTHNNESEWSAKLDYKIPFSFFDKQVSGNIKLGGKWRAKDRNRVSDRWSAQVYNTGVGNNSVATVPDRFQYEPDFSTNGLIGIMSFLDPDFSAPRFLNGESPYLNINYALDRNKVRQFFNNNNPYPMIVPDFSGNNTVSGNLYQYTPNSKVQDEYAGSEDIYAGYLMGEINIGKMITFIPGVRLDYQTLHYWAWSGEGISDNIDDDVNLVSLTKQWANNTQLFVLPQIHLKVKPVSWFDVRLAYTQTISRPDYNYLAPRTQIYTTVKQINYTTTKLKSSKSENYDLIFSFFSNKYGLFTAGLFRKNIRDFIYQRTAAITPGTATDPSVFGLENTYNGYTITYPLNNPGDSYINGIEIEGQTNFHWLPQSVKALRGIVLSGNISMMKSRSEYYNIVPRSTTEGVVNVDTIYVDRLLMQPSLLANISLGYDIKGFSARVSYAYQGDVLTTAQTRADGYDKTSTKAFSRWDLQLKQKLNKTVSFYFNMTNIFNTPDKGYMNATGFNTSIGYYGMGMNLGVKIDLRN